MEQALEEGLKEFSDEGLVERQPGLMLEKP